MSGTNSPARRGSIISNCTNDSDIASDKTPISGQPKKLRKQINNDEFKQNYFELSLNNTGVQVLAFQPGGEATPKKRKRSSRRKSVSSTVADDSNEETESPKVQTKTKQTKKRKQSVSCSVDTPCDELFSDDATLQAIDQSLRLSCDQSVLESLFQQPNESSKKEMIAFDNFLPKSAFKDMKKGRNLACSTTNIQTTSSVSYSLKNSPQTPNSTINNHVNSHIILNQPNSNTIRKRSNSCVSVGQLSNGPIPSINNNNKTNNTCTLSPPERMMAKEMKLNVFLSLRKEQEESQNSPMTCSPQSAQPEIAMSSVSTAPPMMNTQCLGQTLDGSFQIQPRNFMESGVSAAQRSFWEGLNICATNQHPTGYNHPQQQTHSTFFNDETCKQLVNCFFPESGNGGLDPSLFESILQDSMLEQQTTPNYSNHSNDLSLESLQSMDSNQLQNLIDYLERLQTSKKESQEFDFQHTTCEDHQRSNPPQLSNEPFLMIVPDEFHGASDEFMF